MSSEPLFAGVSARRQGYRDRLAAALRARLYPVGPHAREVADAIGVTPRFIQQLAAGERCDCAGFVMGQLCAFFGLTFWIDVYGELGAAMAARFTRSREKEG